MVVGLLFVKTDKLLVMAFYTERFGSTNLLIANVKGNIMKTPNVVTFFGFL